MSIEAFFAATDEVAMLRAAEAGARVELPCAVVHPAAKAACQRELGITATELAGILGGTLALLPEGQVLEESALADEHPDADFEALTCADSLAARLPNLLLRHVPIEPERAPARGERLIPPLDEIDVAYVELSKYADHLRHMQGSAAPEIITRQLRVRIQEAFEGLVAARLHQPPPDRWEPYDRLMPGGSSATRCGAPLAIFAQTAADDPSAPLDCFVLPGAFLVMFPFLSVVIGEYGEIRDTFPTCGLRPVGAGPTTILFVDGGGPASSSSHFSPTPIVRDVSARKWVEGALPPGLPRHVAGTIGDVKWAIVADLDRGLGYHISPGWLGDQCGATTTSLDGIHAYDGGWFVVEAASGKRVLDMRFFHHEVRAFMQLADGAFRFLALPPEPDEDEDEPDEDEPDEDQDEDEPEPRADTLPSILDEDGTILRTIPCSAAALGPDGRSALYASETELVLLDLESGERRLTIDLGALSAPLAFPDAAADGSAPWRDLLATYGVAEAVAGQTPASIREAFEKGFIWSTDIDDAALDAAIELARLHPPLSEVRRLAVRRADAG